MSDAIWLFFGLPKWYLSNLLDPFDVGPLSIVPFVGILSLVVGLALGVRKRDRFLWRFGLPFLASQLLVAVAGLLRGDLPGSQAVFVLAPFMFVILGWSSYLVYKATGARVPAFFLAVFTLSYAAYASFVSWMSFADSWM